MLSLELLGKITAFSRLLSWINGSGRKAGNEWEGKWEREGTWKIKSLFVIIIIIFISDSNIVNHTKIFIQSEGCQRSLLLTDWPPK